MLKRDTIPEVCRLARLRYACVTREGVEFVLGHEFDSLSAAISNACRADDSPTCLLQRVLVMDCRASGSPRPVVQVERVAHVPRVLLRFLPEDLACWWEIDFLLQVLKSNPRLTCSDFWYFFRGAGGGPLA
jgi:hypothetical protein